MATSSVQVMEITMVLCVNFPALEAMSYKAAQLECASTIWGGQEWSQPVHVSEYFATLLKGLWWFSQKWELEKRVGIKHNYKL